MERYVFQYSPVGIYPPGKYSLEEILDLYAPEKQGLRSIKYLHDVTGIPRQTLKQWLTGQRKPSDYMINYLYLCLRESAPEYFGGLKYALKKGKIKDTSPEEIYRFLHPDEVLQETNTEDLYDSYAEECMNLHMQALSDDE